MRLTLRLELQLGDSQGIETAASESSANSPPPPINSDPPLEVYAEHVGDPFVGPGFQRAQCQSTPVNATA